MHELASEGSASKSVKGAVLLVDDDLPVLNAYGRVLRRAGFAVEQVADGGSVADRIAADDFDAVVSDICLPGVHGIDVLRAVRRHDADLPVILMTGQGDLQSAVEAVEHGAFRYLLKPVNASVLSEATEQAVRCRQLARIKRRGSDLYGSITSQRSDHAELAERFDRALETLHMAFQPIVRWSGREVFGYEALVRTEEASMRQPLVLIAAAERLQRVVDLGRTIRREVAESIRTAGRRMCVFMNLHPLDLDDPELIDPNAPLSRLAEHVVLEITERASLEGVDIRARLATLRRLGFRIALDDLGAGYAGLSSFAQLQPDIIKLDMSLIRRIDKEPVKQRIVQTMRGLCDELGMLVVAEGVETVPEREMLVTLGCELLQGYLFAKPGRAFPPVTFADLHTQGSVRAIPGHVRASHPCADATGGASQAPPKRLQGETTLGG